MKSGKLASVSEIGLTRTSIVDSKDNPDCPNMIYSWGRNHKATPENITRGSAAGSGSTRLVLLRSPSLAVPASGVTGLGRSLPLRRQGARSRGALWAEPKMREHGVDAFLARRRFSDAACPNECVDQLRRFARLGQADITIGNRGQDCGHRGGAIHRGAQRGPDTP
jgi:hypothetical protein